MGLLERLKAAEAARRAEAGEPPDIDLTSEEAAAAERTAKPPVWGRPSRCPACNEPGYLDHIDLVRRVMYQHCPTCMHKWDIIEADCIVG